METARSGVSNDGRMEAKVSIRKCSGGIKAFIAFMLRIILNFPERLGMTKIGDRQSRGLSITLSIASFSSNAATSAERYCW